jgi:hypothetical protein
LIAKVGSEEAALRALYLHVSMAIKDTKRAFST